MNKIFLIIKREYLTRIRKKSFLIMSLLGPLIFATFSILPAWLMTRESEEMIKVAVIDSSGEFINKIPETKTLKFEYISGISVNSFKKVLKNSQEFNALLFISPSITYAPSHVWLYYYNQPNLNLSSHISNALKKEIEAKKLQTFNIENLDKIMESVKTDVAVQSVKISEKGEKASKTEILMIISYAAGFLIYMFIFMFGAQVMRSVIEEKTSRIVEIIISSVKPFQLMIGKVFGVMLVVLTQISIWIVMTMALSTVAQNFISHKSNSAKIEATSQNIMTQSGTIAAPQSPAMNQGNTEAISEIFSYFDDIPVVQIVSWFIFFFIGGYLLYGSLFAAIGSVVDTDTDTQQFMLPITIPLMLGLFVMFYTLNNYNSPVAFWFSMIPLTSPIVMMARIPFGVPAWQIWLSAFILIASFIGAIWMAGKIYRTGILLYGKKVSYKEIFKWLTYKN